MESSVSRSNAHTPGLVLSPRRQANVECSEYLRPDEFETTGGDDDERLQQEPSVPKAASEEALGEAGLLGASPGAMTQQSASVTPNQNAFLSAEGGEGKPSFFSVTQAAVHQAQENAILKRGILSEEDEAAIIKQVEYNAKMFKLKMVSLLKMTVTSEEETKNSEEIEKLQGEIDKTHLPPRQLRRQSVTMPQAFGATPSPLQAPIGGASATANEPTPRVALVTPREDRSVSNNSQPSSSRRGSNASANGWEALRDNVRRNSRPTSPFSPNTVGQQLSPEAEAMLRENHQKMEYIRTSVDSHFRFAFEELALRWRSMQEHPFSLKTYHEVMKEQIYRREESKHDAVVSKQRAKAVQQQLDEATMKLEKHTEEHEERLKEYYQELVILRNRIEDLQRRIGGAHDNPPELLNCEDRAVETRERERRRAEKEENERHSAFMLKRANEELTLLKHTLNERSNFVKALEREVNSSRTEAVTTRAEMKKYLEDQEAIDAQFHALVDENTERIEDLENANEDLQNDVDDREGTITTLEEQVSTLTAARSKLEADVREVNRELADFRSGNRQAGDLGPFGQGTVQPLDSHAVGQPGATETDELEDSLLIPQHMMGKDSKSASPKSGARRRSSATAPSGRRRSSVSPPQGGTRRRSSVKPGTSTKDGARRKSSVTMNASASSDLINVGQGRRASSAASQRPSTSGRRSTITAAKDAARLQELKDEVDEKSSRISGLEEEIQVMMAEREDMKAEHERAESRATKRAVEIQNLKQQLTGHKAALAKANEELLLEKANPRETERVIALNEQVANLEAQLRQQAQKHREIQVHLVDDMMNLHRQLSIAEDFLHAYVPEDRLKYLAKRLRGDDTSQEETTQVHTPRTKEYYKLSAPRRASQTGVTPIFNSSINLPFFGSASQTGTPRQFGSPNGERHMSNSSGRSRPSSRPTSAQSRRSPIDSGNSDPYNRSQPFSSMPLIGGISELATPPEGSTSEHRQGTPSASQTNEVDEYVAFRHDDHRRSSASVADPPLIDINQYMTVEGDSQRSHSNLSSIMSGRQHSFKGAGVSKLRSLFQKSRLTMEFVKATQLGIEAGDAIANMTGSSDSPHVVAAESDTIVRQRLENSLMAIADLSSQLDALQVRYSALQGEHETLTAKFKTLEEEHEVTKPLAQLKSLRRGTHNTVRSARESFIEIPQDGFEYSANVAPSPDGFEDSTRAPTAVSHDSFMRNMDPRDLMRRAKTGAMTTDSTLLEEFPGIEHAHEHYDLFEGFHTLRLQLLRLLELCVQEAERGALQPDDIEHAQAIVHDKFVVFRSIESHSNGIVQKMRRKKEDIMRRREEELHLVLRAMQNISMTHPKEAQQLTRVAKQAAIQRGRHVTKPSDDAVQLANQIAIEVQRPASAMELRHASLRQMSPSPDVSVEGASASMSMRKQHRPASSQSIRRGLPPVK